MKTVDIRIEAEWLKHSASIRGMDTKLADAVIAQAQHVGELERYSAEEDAVLRQGHVLTELFNTMAARLRRVSAAEALASRIRSG